MQDLHFIPNFITLLGVLDCQATMSRSQLLVWCFSWLSCFWGGMRAISSEFHQKMGGFQPPTLQYTLSIYSHRLDLPPTQDAGGQHQDHMTW